MSEGAGEGGAPADEDTHYRALLALGFPARVARRMADRRRGAGRS